MKFGGDGRGLESILELNVGSVYVVAAYGNMGILKHKLCPIHTADADETQLSS